jgi:hypothetical protein
MRTRIVRGDSSWNCGHSRPKLPKTRGEKFSTTASLVRIRRFMASRPSGCERSSVSERLLVLAAR